ncbi:hypothetical protein Dred_1061 [Desulforamulus reducens MI-1]|uniref:Stage III sporulation protein AF n=1 Tax=Desulforamulus reducens (strain ATCC BAA-1160 / DSM 100696 / MI-1) TaxID=349161 RepID=A4J3E3_DESRM|nr:hypothetical protein Dred_1061 [Desulforamulus reducens MI-1]
MESIKELVQALVIIIVMVLFLEMFLPNNDMQRYVKMVMGLLVIVVVMEAGANFIRQDFKFDLPALTKGNNTSSLESIMHAGQKLAGKQKQEALQEYQQGIEKQVLALAKLQKDITISGVQVTTLDKPEDPNYGRLTGIVLEISPNPVGDQQIQRVEPIQITVGATGTPNTQKTSVTDSEQARRLARTVADFYNIPLEQVKVVEGS